MLGWTSPDSDCWRCCLASLTGRHPTELLQAEPFDLEEQNRHLARWGRVLVPVWAHGTWAESYPAGRWIALLGRGRELHAVLAERNQVILNPAFRDGRPAHLWPDDFAYVGNHSWPLGFVLEEV